MDNNGGATSLIMSHLLKVADDDIDIALGPEVPIYNHWAPTPEYAAQLVADPETKVSKAISDGHPATFSPAVTTEARFRFTKRSTTESLSKTDPTPFDEATKDILTKAIMGIDDRADGESDALFYSRLNAQLRRMGHPEIVVTE